MEKIIGDKNQVAIEFSITNHKSFMGHARIWLGGSILGASRDLIFFESYLFILLKQFCNSKQINSEFISSDISKVYEKLKKYTFDDDKYDGGIYRCSGATFTDDFYIFSYLQNGDINIIWHLTETLNYEDLKKIGFNIFHFKMEKENFCEIINQIIDYIRFCCKR